MAIFVFKGVKIVIYTVCLFQILFYSSADLQQGYFAQFVINGHIEIPSGSAVGPATAITGWGKEPKQLTGFFPALTKRDFVRAAALTARLPEMREELKNLQKQVAQLAELIQKAEAADR